VYASLHYEIDTESNIDSFYAEQVPTTEDDTNENFRFGLSIESPTLSQDSE